MGISRSEVNRLLHEAHEDARPDPEKIRATQDRIREISNTLIETWVPRAKKDDKDAALVVIKLLDRVAKLDGADAPAKLDVNLAQRELTQALATLKQATPPTDLKPEDVYPWVLSVFAGAAGEEGASATPVGEAPSPGLPDGGSAGDRGSESGSG